jgi:CheY-like chemotaxis protein
MSLFDPQEMPDLTAGVDRWISVRPRAGRAMLWKLHTQSLRKDGSRLILLSAPEAFTEIKSTTLELLLGTPQRQHDRWPFPGRVLVVDDDSSIRHVLVRQFDQRGAGSYAVGTPAEALRLLLADDGIAYVVVDFDLPQPALDDAIHRIRAVRTDAVLIGTSGSIRRDEFSKLGVEHYLQKPWRAGDLINLLLGRLGNCVDCGLYLPLRSPRANEAAVSWICAGCGGRYRGVLDDSISAEHHGNALRAEGP